MAVLSGLIFSNINAPSLLHARLSHLAPVITDGRRTLHQTRIMQKVIAATNMTLDGFCDHTAVIPDEEIHQHYTDLLTSPGTILYGRVTYQLMEYWREVLRNPTGEKSSDDFAVAIDKIPKVVFSHSLKEVDWPSARLATEKIEDEIENIRQQSTDDILVGSPGLIAALTNKHLIDEYQICIHPVVTGKGLPLFRNIEERNELRLLKTKHFQSGAILCYYAPVRLSP